MREGERVSMCDVVFSDESEVIMVTDDDIAPVAYLKLHQLHLEKKNPVSYYTYTLSHSLLLL